MAFFKCSCPCSPILFHNGASCESRERYRWIFEADLVWRYPIVSTIEDGCIIIPIHKGFLQLLYDAGNVEPTNYYRVKDVNLLDIELEIKVTKVHLEPFFFVEHNPKQPE